MLLQSTIVSNLISGLSCEYLRSLYCLFILWKVRGFNLLIETVACLKPIEFHLLLISCIIIDYLQVHLIDILRMK